jgi:hypothetical protein
VKTKDQKWIWVDPMPGTFVVNIGDMLTVQFKWSFVNFLGESRGSSCKLDS